MCAFKLCVGFLNHLNYSHTSVITFTVCLCAHTETRGFCLCSLLHSFLPDEATSPVPYSSMKQLLLSSSTSVLSSPVPFLPSLFLCWELNPGLLTLLLHRLFDVVFCFIKQACSAPVRCPAPIPFVLIFL